MDELTKKGEKACAFPGCKKPVSDDDECFGCGYYICEDHSDVDVYGQHDPVDHWTESDEGDEDDGDEE